jgi:hypothetical protein
MGIGATLRFLKDNCRSNYEVGKQKGLELKSKHKQILDEKLKKKEKK